MSSSGAGVGGSGGTTLASTAGDAVPGDDRLEPIGVDGEHAQLVDAVDRHEWFADRAESACVSCGLHDVLALETAGRPAVLVASGVFEQAAGDQAAKLGVPDPRRVFVEHPSRDRTDGELRAMLEAAGDVMQRSSSGQLLPLPGV